MIAALVATALVLGGIAIRDRVAAPRAPWLKWLAINLALAWTPAILSSVAGSGWPFLVPAWLLLLPNAPYLVTDLAYLRDPAWASGGLDTTLLLAVALLGLAIGVLSLHQMATVTGHALGVSVVASVAVGFGVYFGRVLRRYSWDVILRPGALLADLFKLVRYPIANRKAWALIAGAGIGFFAAAIVSGVSVLET